MATPAVPLLVTRWIAVYAPLLLSLTASASGQVSRVDHRLAGEVGEIVVYGPYEDKVKVTGANIFPGRTR
jgi:hypothetical protein